MRPSSQEIVQEIDNAHQARESEYIEAWVNWLKGFVEKPLLSSQSLFPEELPVPTWFVTLTHRDVTDRTTGQKREVTVRELFRAARETFCGYDMAGYLMLDRGTGRGDRENHYHFHGVVKSSPPVIKHAALQWHRDHGFQLVKQIIPDRKKDAEALAACYSLTAMVAHRHNVKYRWHSRKHLAPSLEADPFLIIEPGTKPVKERKIR